MHKPHSIFEAAVSVLTGKYLLEENLGEAVANSSKFKEGDVVVWYNGPLTFKEKVVKMKDGRLGVRGVRPDQLIPIDSISLPLEKSK